jgi:hypothetical protein
MAERWLSVALAAVVLAYGGFRLASPRLGVSPETREIANVAATVALMVIVFLFAMAQIPG